jgi:hypothetical protein
VGPPWILALVLLVVAAVGYKILRGGLGDAKFVVRVRAAGVEGVQIEGQVPGHGTQEVAAFVAGLELPPGAKIWGVPDRDRIVLRFSAEVPEHLHQRLRNFFYLHI